MTKATNNDAHEVIDLANSILKELERKNLDPILCYAALGCAFQHVHLALGQSVEEWLSTTKEMADIMKEEEK